MYNVLCVKALQCYVGKAVQCNVGNTCTMLCR